MSFFIPPPTPFLAAHFTCESNEATNGPMHGDTYDNFPTAFSPNLEFTDQKFNNIPNLTANFNANTFSLPKGTFSIDLQYRLEFDGANNVNAYRNRCIVIRNAANNILVKGINDKLNVANSTIETPSENFAISDYLTLTAQTTIKFNMWVIVGSDNLALVQDYWSDITGQKEIWGSLTFRKVK